MTQRPTPQLQPGQTRMQQVERLQAEIERLRAYIESLDGKHIGIRADNCFIDDGIVVASDILEPRTMTERQISIAAPRTDEERKIATAVEQGYDAGWADAKEEAQDEIERLTKERDEIKSEASELAADLRRAMGENERLRAAPDGLQRYSFDDQANRMEQNWSGEFVRIDDLRAALKNAAEQKAGD